MRKTKQEVYDAIYKHGPIADHILVPIVQHEGDLHQSSSGIRSRRAELSEEGLLKEVSTVKMPSGREAVVWQVA